jgi:hypothetical protein
MIWACGGRGSRSDMQGDQTPVAKESCCTDLAGSFAKSDLTGNAQVVPGEGSRAGIQSDQLETLSPISHYLMLSQPPLFLSPLHPLLCSSFSFSLYFSSLFLSFILKKPLQIVTI